MRLGRRAEPHPGGKDITCPLEEQDSGRGLVENKNCVDGEDMGGGRNGNRNQRQP